MADLLSGIYLSESPKQLEYFDRTYSLRDVSFTIRSWHSVIDQLNATSVTATGALCCCNKLFAMTHNPRGWDIPGGHLEPNESILDALQREIKEEINATLLSCVPLFVLESNKYNFPTFIPIFFAQVQIDDFNANHSREGEISGVKLVNKVDFLNFFHGDSIFSSALFEAALSLISK